MCIGTPHKEWYCCRNFLQTILNNPGVPLLTPFIEAGHADRVLKVFDGYPPHTPMPSLVIEVIQEIEGNRIYKNMAQVSYFALDAQAGAHPGTWFQITAKRWLGMRPRMRFDTPTSGRCAIHEVGHNFVVWREHNLRLIPAERSRSQSPESLHVLSKAKSRKNRRKGKGKGTGNGNRNTYLAVKK